MFKKVFYSCVFTAALGGVALSDSNQYFTFDTEERDTSLAVISRVGKVHSSEGIFIKMPGESQFIFEASGKGTYEDYLDFKGEAHSALEFVKSSLIENGSSLDCNSEGVHPNEYDGWLTISGIPLSDLKDPHVMAHRKSGDKVSEYPSELLYALKDTASAYVCIDCSSDIKREALVREISEYFAIQCKIDNKGELVESLVQKFNSRGSVGNK